MRFVLSVDMDNAAFEDRGELPRILKDVAKRYERGDVAGTVRDENGNTVGEYAVQP